MKHTNKCLAFLMILAVLCLCGCSKSVKPDKVEEQIEETLQPGENSSKQPKDYTWAEYEAMTEQEKAVFIASFESAEAFENWKNSVTGTSEVETMPWEGGGKQPAEYTWAEYEALTVSQKEAFFDSFGSTVEFDAWMSRATGTSEVETMPWEAGGKQPKEYTWAEYEALTASQKEAFYDSLGSSVEFDNWMSRVTGTATIETMPWEAGGKEPAEYTWAEYEALPASQKDAFYDSFEGAEAFENWKNGVTGSNGASLPWEEGGKDPSEYTLAEYEALNASLKEAFYDSFESSVEFDAWMSRATGSDETSSDAAMPWEKAGKEPSEYIWAEYEALTASQKEAFYDSFADVNDFEAWLNANQK